MRASILLLSLSAAACAAPADDRHSPLAAMQRVLAIDFGAPALGRRLDGLQRVPGALAGEFHRTPTMVASTPAMDPELARLDRARDRTASLLASVVARHPRLPARLPERWVQHLVDAAATVPYVLGMQRRPLGELDDREHRPDPSDPRPEATLLQRLARRLLLTR